MKSTKTFIISTAIKLFNKKGYEKTTLDDIITKTNLSKGGIYHYFKSKEEILSEYLDPIIDEIINKGINILSKDEKLPLNKLKKWIKVKEELFTNQKYNIIQYFTDAKYLYIQNYIVKKFYNAIMPCLEKTLDEISKINCKKLKFPKESIILYLSMYDTVYFSILKHPKYKKDFPKFLKAAKYNINMFFDNNSNEN